ncbi:MAG: four helix bundle protein [Bryobacteraceae bacterium]
MRDPSKQEPAVVVTKAYDFVLWLLPKVENFPRSYRFSVGERLVSTGLDLLMALVQASYVSEKTLLLQTASVNTNTVRYLVRLSKDLRLVNTAAYEFASGGAGEWELPAGRLSLVSGS